jgi:hypothetical protein
MRGFRRFGRRTWWTVAAVVLLLLGGGAAAGVVLKARHDDKVKKQREEAARATRRRAEERAVERRQRQAANRVELEERKLLVRALESSVTKDAKKTVDDGLFDGPILRTQCDAAAGSLRDLSANTGTFECTAVNKDNPDGTSEGYRFSATVNYSTGEYRWHLGG